MRLQLNEVKVKEYIGFSYQILFVFLYKENTKTNHVNQTKMTKTIELLIEKSRMLMSGLNRHISEMGERGVTKTETVQLAHTLSVLEQQSNEVEKLRAELATKVKLQNETMNAVKTSYAELKKTLKGYYPQERWLDYGIPDRR